METKQCLICSSTEIIDPIDPLHSECFGCRMCITEWIVTKIIETRASINNAIPCHANDCADKVTINEVYKILTQDYQERINEALFKVYLIKDIRKCP